MLSLYTLPQKKHNFNFRIFHGDRGPRSVARRIREILYNCRFSDIHSSQKERQLLNLLEASSFVKFKRWLVPRCLMTVREWRGIIEWGFWQIGTRSMVKIIFGPNFTDLHSSPKERQLQKSCVSVWGRVYIIVHNTLCWYQIDAVPSNIHHHHLDTEIPYNTALCQWTRNKLSYKNVLQLLYLIAHEIIVSNSVSEYTNVP